VANDFSGRILKITTVPATCPLANFKVKGGQWTGGTSGQTFTITDIAGRIYTWTYPAEGVVQVYEIGWLSGPVTFGGTMTAGEVELYLPAK
jgi:hypothetical protein